MEGEIVGVRSNDGLVYGAHVHGLFLDDRFREVLLGRLGLPVATGLSHQRSVDAAPDEPPAALEAHRDVEALLG